MEAKSGLAAFDRKAHMLRARMPDQGGNMGFKKWADAKAKKLGWADMALVKISAFFFALMLARLWAPLLSLDWQWYALICVLAGIKPAYDVFRGK